MKIIEEMKTTFQANFPFEKKQTASSVSPSEIVADFSEQDKEPTPKKPIIQPENTIIPKLEKELKIKIINQDQIRMESEKIGIFAHGDIFPGKWNGKPVILRKYAYSQINEDLEKKLLNEFTKLQSMKSPIFNNFYGVYLEKETDLLYSVHEFFKATLPEKLKTKLTHREKSSIIMQIINIIYFQTKRNIFYEKIELKNFVIAENGQLQWCYLGFNDHISSEIVSKLKIGEKNVDVNGTWFLGLMMYEIYMEETLWKESQFNEIEEIKKYKGENPENVNEIIRKCLEFKYSERMNIEEVSMTFERKIFAKMNKK